MMQRNRLCDAAFTGILLLLLIAFLFVTVNGLFVSCDVEIFYSLDNNEHVVFLTDQPLLLAAAVLAAAALLWLLLRVKVTDALLRILTITMLAAQSLLALWWISAANAVPYADSQVLLDAAKALSAGNAKALMSSDYFLLYPYQLGFVRYAELFADLFGANNLNLTLAIGNVVCLNAIFLALLAITRKLFNDRRTELVVVVLLALCPQPAFLCTFLYGVFPGLALALWGSYFTIRFLREGKAWLLLPATLLIGAAILLKENNKILLIANVLMLLVYALRKKRFAVLGGVACMITVSMLLPFLVQRHYEAEAETEFGKGTPLGAWLVTGLSESSFCSGWFNSYQLTVMPENNYDPSAASAQIRIDAMERIRVFLSRPRYMASFWYHKLTSQWNEPTFQCIWSSAAGGRSDALSPIAFSLSYGAGNRAFDAYCNVFDQLVYTGFVLTLLTLLRKKERRADEMLLLPLAIFGIFLYHALFEAKAQFALPPFLMMMPYAAYGFVALLAKAPADNVE